MWAARSLRRRHLPWTVERASGALRSCQIVHAQVGLADGRPQRPAARPTSLTSSVRGGAACRSGGTRTPSSPDAAIGPLARCSGGQELTSPATQLDLAACGPQARQQLN